jgi:hypothetical protein
MSKRCWDARCSEILRLMAGHYHDHEIAASIEAETGKRFIPRTVAEYRRVAGLAPCRRNDWTAALKKIAGKGSGISIRPFSAGAAHSHFVSVGSAATSAYSNPRSPRGFSKSVLRRP